MPGRANPEVRKDYPLFPIGRVLFPGGHLELQIFEQRYLDMISRQLREDRGFGIVLLDAGAEVGEAAAFYPVGTCARISDFDLRENGLLLVQLEGRRKFRVLDSRVEPDQLIVAEIVIDELPANQPIRDRDLDLRDLMLRFVEHPAIDIQVTEAQAQDADFVANRLAELLPIDERIKQELLETTDSYQRLNRVRQEIAKLS